MPPEEEKDKQGAALIEYRLGLIEESIRKMTEAITSLLGLEQRHLTTNKAIERAFGDIKDLDTRLSEIENEMPTLKLVRGWVLALMVGSFSMLVGILLLLLLGGAP